jgi:hypothetical protein
MPTHRFTNPMPCGRGVTSRVRLLRQARGSSSLTTTELIRARHTMQRLLAEIHAAVPVHVHRASDVRDDPTPVATRARRRRRAVVRWLVYRRDVIDRLHVGEPHQVDLWRIAREPSELEPMIAAVVGAALPVAAWRTQPAVHPYTTEGLQIDVLHDGERRRRVAPGWPSRPRDGTRPRSPRDAARRPKHVVQMDGPFDIEELRAEQLVADERRGDNICTIFNLYGSGSRTELTDERGGLFRNQRVEYSCATRAVDTRNDAGLQARGELRGERYIKGSVRRRLVGAVA